MITRYVRDACASLALLALTLLACDPSDPCDKDYYEEHGACFPIRTAPDASADAGGDDEDGGDERDAEAPSADPYEGFGEACTEQTDCPSDFICGAPMLALCTKVNCMEDPELCPPDWTCFDTTGLSPDPSVTSICLNL